MRCQINPQRMLGGRRRKRRHETQHEGHLMLLMTRSDLKRLSRMRLRDAKMLLDGRQYDGAYYLCGYAVECGLKACIAKSARRFQFPDLDFVKSCYSHSFKALVTAAG